MPTKSQTRWSPLATDDEEELLAEIEWLRHEVDRLSRQLTEERLDRAVQQEVKTVLSTLVNPQNVPAGRRLADGRYIPSPLTVGGTVRPAEPGAPRVAVPDDEDRSAEAQADHGECEFAPGDESASAFDDFFNAPDPQLDKIRRFLLD